MERGIVIHNHPQNGNFSQQDVDSLLKFKLKKLVAVTDNCEFVLTLQEHGDILTKDMLDNRIEYATMRNLTPLEKWKEVFNGTNYRYEQVVFNE